MTAQSLPRRSIESGAFVIASSGFAEGPAEALARYLTVRRARLVEVVNHPLVAEGPAYHEITTSAHGERFAPRRRRLVHRPPWSYPLDLVVPVTYPRVDVWFAFNALAVARGLVERRLGRCQRVVSWHVDFVPDRFGPGPLTTIFDRADRMACRMADLRVELSEDARRRRTERHRLGGEAAPSIVVPMGAWVTEVASAHDDAWARRRVVFLGHLVERQGVRELFDAFEILAESDCSFTADIIGGGPLEEELRARASAGVLRHRVTIHGFVEDFADVTRLLSESTVAVAPYREDVTSYSQYADPGKLKSYLAAGLPIVMTAVPPNAASLADGGVATLVAGRPEDIAQGLRRLLQDEDAWRTAHHCALAAAKTFDWPTLLDEVATRVGFEP